MQRAHYTAVCDTAAGGELDDYIPVHNKQGGPSPVVSTTKVWHAKSQQDSALGIVVPIISFVLDAQAVAMGKSSIYLASHTPF